MENTDFNFICFGQVSGSGVTKQKIKNAGLIAIFWLVVCLWFLFLFLFLAGGDKNGRGDEVIVLAKAAYRMIPLSHSLISRCTHNVQHLVLDQTKESLAPWNGCICGGKMFPWPIETATGFDASSGGNYRRKQDISDPTNDRAFCIHVYTMTSSIEKWWTCPFSVNISGSLPHWGLRGAGKRIGIHMDIPPMSLT